jgi:hypothetical protein
MIDPTKEVRQFYLALLNGTISVPVRNFATAQLAPPFVVVSTRANYAGTKDSFEYNCTTILDIVVKTGGDVGGDRAAEDIANEIIPILLGLRPIYGNTTNFKIVTLTVESSDPFLDLSGTGKTVRKLIQIDNFVSYTGAPTPTPTPAPEGFDYTLDSVIA